MSARSPIVLLFAAAGLFTASLSGQDPRCLPAAPRVLWRLDKLNFYADLAIHDGRFWIGGLQLTAHELQTGEEVHRVEAAGPWQQPVYSGGLVFCRHQAGTLHAFAADLSRQLWQLKLEFSHFPGTTHGDIYFASSGDSVVAIAGGQVHWRADAGSDVAMTPATDGRRVYVGTVSGDVVALDLHTGKEVWRRETGAEFGHSSPVVDGGVLFLADRGVREGRRAAFNAIDATSGEVLWSTEFGATGFSRPHPHGDRVWAGFGVSVASFDRKTGSLDRDGAIRTGRNAFGMPAVIGGQIAFGNLDGNFYVHDLDTGALRWRFEVGVREKSQVGGWALHDGVLVVGTTNGVFGIAETPGAEPVAPGFVLRPAKR